MSCCPPNAERYLAPNYATSGSIHSLPSSGHEIYTSGSSNSDKAVLLIPDVWGWNGGRTRNIADWFAEAGYYVVVPKLLVPALDGGTDGDGLSPGYSFSNPDDAAKFPDYMKTVNWEDVLKPRIASATEHIKSQGATKIHMVGFCWGGWVGSKALASSDLAGDFLSLAIPHPSLRLESVIFGGDVLALVQQIHKPVYFMPCEGDNDEYRVGGAWYEDLKARMPSSQTADYAPQNHGFLPRGDLGNPETHAAVLRALDSIHAFFKAHE